MSLQSYHPYKKFPPVVDYEEMLWNPQQIETALWLDAADAATITLNGTTVSAWADKSGNGRHAAQATATYQPTRITNGLQFDGAGDKFASLAFDFPRPFTVFFVGNNNGAGYRRAIHVGVSSDYCAFIGANGGDYATFFGNGASAWVDTSANVPSSGVSNSGIFCLTNAGSGGSNAIPYVNGTTQTAKDGGTFVGTSKGVCVGGRGGGTDQSWQGAIYEVLILPRVCDLSERQLIEGYLAHKWGALLGITTLVDALPYGHPRKSKPPVIEKPLNYFTPMNLKRDSFEYGINSLSI